MKVLVTGATGFLGGHVLPELLGRGHTVRALARATSDVAGLPASVEVAHGELSDAARAMDGIEALIHLAGVSGAPLRRGDPGRDLQRVNVEGTRAVFAAASRAGARRAVHVTSMWTVLRPDLAPTSSYVRSRCESEEAALAASGGMRTSIACPAFVVGAGDRGPNFPGALVLALLRGRLPFLPPGGMTWIAAADAARALVGALESGRPGERYLIGAEHWSWRDLADCVALHAGRRAPTWTFQTSAMRAGAAAGDLALRLVGRSLPIPLRDGVDLLSVDGPVECRAAWREFGAPRAPVAQANGEAVDWFRGNGYTGYRPKGTRDS